MRLLLIGGGHAHVEVLRRFGIERHAGGRTPAATLISPDRLTPYSGMMPGWIAGHYTREDCHIDLAPLAEFAGVRFERTSVTGIDLVRRVATCASGNQIEFDVASIDIGSTPPLASIPGARAHGLAVKPVGRFIEALDVLVQRATGRAIRRLVAIGGGAAGVEVLLAVRHRLTCAGADHIEYAVVTDTAAILPTHNARTRRAFERIYAQAGIAIHAGVPVAGIDSGRVVLADGRGIDADAAIIATGAAAADWPRASAMATDARGFIRLDSHLRSVSHPFVFGAGDCATVDGPPYPKSGVYAVRQGPVLADNLLAMTADGALGKFEPQRRSLALISAGDRYAVASRGPFAAEGRWVWRWKDSIDRKFMTKYTPAGLRAALGR